MVARDDTRERLARIEGGLSSIEETLERLVSLFDRVIALEVQNTDRDARIQKLETRCEGVQEELQHWRTARIVGTWAVGVAGAVLTAWLVHQAGV